MQKVVLVISGPSAVGKTSVAKALLRNNCSFKRVVTCTTRPMRPREKDGEDYIFLPYDLFEEKLKSGDFVEYSKVYGNYYGILQQTIVDIIDNGQIPLLVINWEGYQKIKKVFPRACGIFLLPPTLEDLENRIRKRSQDSELVIQSRLAEAQADMTHASEFEHQIINADFNKVVNDILHIVDGLCI